MLTKGELSVCILSLGIGVLTGTGIGQLFGLIPWHNAIIGGVICFVCMQLLRPLAKRIDERNLEAKRKQEEEDQYFIQIAKELNDLDGLTKEEIDRHTHRDSAKSEN